jgi:hypothetical protein
MTIIYKQAQPNLNTTPKPVVTENRDDWGYFQKVYDWDKLWPEILREIGNGASLIKAINKPGYPTYDSVQKNMRANPEIRRLYEEAIEIRADHLAESLIDISEETPPEGLDGPQLSAWINQMKIRIDTRKWTAAKLRPKSWGERVDVSVTHTQISINEALRSAEDRLKDKLIDNVTDITPNIPKDNLTIDQYPDPETDQSQNT